MWWIRTGETISNLETTLNVFGHFFWSDWEIKTNRADLWLPFFSICILSSPFFQKLGSSVRKCFINRSPLLSTPKNSFKVFVLISSCFLILLKVFTFKKIALNRDLCINSFSPLFEKSWLYLRFLLFKLYQRCSLRFFHYLRLVTFFTESLILEIKIDFICFDNFSVKQCFWVTRNPSWFICFHLLLPSRPKKTCTLSVHFFQ